MAVAIQIDNKAENNIIQFPNSKKEYGIGKSTKMWCLKSQDEIRQVYDVFMEKVNEANTENKYTIALRNLTMFVCAINIEELFRQQQQISYKTNSNIKIDYCSNFVFTTNRGTNLSARALQYTLKYLSDDMNASRKVILPHVTPHVLRHTACTKMINSGMNIKAVQTIMGHADIGVTLETYTHINNEQLRNEIKKLEYVSE